MRGLCDRAGCQCPTQRDTAVLQLPPATRPPSRPQRHAMASGVVQYRAVLLAGPCRTAVFAPHCPTLPYPAPLCPAVPRPAPLHSYLLPPVIFYAGLSVQRRLFFRNLPTILR